MEEQLYLGFGLYYRRFFMKKTLFFILVILVLMVSSCNLFLKEEYGELILSFDEAFPTEPEPWIQTGFPVFCLRL